MTILYPLPLPSVKSFARLTMRSRNVVGVTESPYSLKAQTQDFGGQRWEAEFTLPLMARQHAEAWGTFFDELNGPVGTFLAGRPKADEARGAVRMTPNAVTVDGGGQSGQSLDVKAALADTAGFFLRGDMLQLGTGATTRLYRVIQDADLEDGEAQLTIWPRLRIAPGDGDAVVVASPKGIWRLVTAAPEFEEDAAGLMQFGGVAIREAL